MKEIVASNEHFFEGSEKLLEIWFNPEDSKNCDLRIISHEDIVSTLEKVNCQIISSLSNDHMNSYVLSESSLFISKRRIILKTCGTTCLLNALKPLLCFGKNLGFKEYQIFYSRRRFLLPEHQPSIHQNFYSEIKFLDKEIQAAGSAYTFGRLNDECWNLFVTDKPKLNEETDQTFEMIMSDLDPVKMKVFFKNYCQTGEDATRMSGIDKLFLGADIDSFQFEPCGYSMNGLIFEDQYFTIHVTPEKDFSYASFETNCADEDYLSLIRKLIKIFGPKKFFFTLLSDEGSPISESHNKLHRNWHDYQLKDWQRSVVADMDLTFACFVRNPG